MSREVILSPTKQKTRDKIIKASKKLFYKYGIEKTTLIEIAVESGMNRRTVYDHFSNKNMIISKILKQYFSELYDIDLSIIIEDTEIKKLKKLIHIVYDRYMDNPTIMKFIFNYYQMNPVNIEEEKYVIRENDNVEKLFNFINFSKVRKGREDELMEDIEIVIQHILSLGMRYSLRKDSVLGFPTNISRTSLHRSIEVLMQILDE